MTARREITGDFGAIGPRKKTGRPSPPRKNFPYYKVYEFSSSTVCWVEARIAAFDTLAEARVFIHESISPAPARIVVIEATGRRVLEDVGEDPPPTTKN